MTKYEQNNKKLTFIKNQTITQDIESKILNLSVCHDKSSLFIPTKNNFKIRYSFREILNPEEKNRRRKKKNPKLINDIASLKNYLKIKKALITEPIFEVAPRQDNDTFLTVSIGYIVLIIQLLKGKIRNVQHEQKSICKFMKWEDDFLICAFENKKILIIQNLKILKSFQEEDSITSMNIIQLNDIKLIVFGFNKKVKIFRFYLMLEKNEFYPYIISNLDGNIDIIEQKNQYILFCSKENKIIYVYQFINNNWKPQMLFEMNRFNFKDLDPEQEIINVKLISYEGIAVTFQNKIYLFYFQGNKFQFNDVYQEDKENICFSSIMYARNQYYLIYALEKKIKIIEIKIRDNEYKNLKYLSGTNLEKNKEAIENCINTLLNKKNDFSITKIDDFIIHIEIDFVTLKIEFNIKDLSMDISILKCIDDILRKRIEEEIEKIKINEEEKNNDFTQYFTENLIILNRIIKNFDFSDSMSEGGSEIEKIKKEQFLTSYEIFKNWILISKNKIPTKNLFNEDDEFDLDNKIMGENIKSLIPKWNFVFDELNIDKAFTFANSNYYSSSKSNKLDETENKKNPSEKLTNDKAVIYKLTKESFQIYLDKIKEKKNIPYEMIFILVDILQQIKFYLKEIVNQASTNLIRLYRDSIITILVTLESNLHFEFLFLCIIPLSELIYKDIEKSNYKISYNNLNKSPMKGTFLQNRRNSDNNKIIKKNISKCDLSSDSFENSGNDDKNDFYLDTKESNNNQIAFNKEYKEYYNEFKINKNSNSYKKRFSYTQITSKNIDDFPKKSKNNLLGKFNKTNISISSNKFEKNLIEILTSNFCNTIIDYVIFYTEELKLLKIDSPDENLINFFNLVNKYYETQEIKNEINKIVKKY